MPEKNAILFCHPRFTLILNEALEQVYLIDELESVILFGKEVVEILRCVNGRRTFDSIAAEVAPVLGMDVAGQVINQLVQDGIVLTQGN